MISKPEWLNRILTDLTTREFIAIKILYFLIFGGMMTLFPFLTIHARSLGIREQELGMVYGLLPVFGILASPVTGMLADKIGNFKILLSLTILSSGFASLLFLVVPVGRVTQPHPQSLPITLNCTAGSYKITITPPYSCNFANLTETTKEVTRCALACPNNKTVSIATSERDVEWCAYTEGCSVKSRSEGLIEVNARPIEEFAFDDPPSHVYNDSLASVIHTTNIGFPALMVNDDICPTWFKESERSSSCFLVCSGHIDNEAVCSNKHTVVDVNPTFTFICYLIVRLTNGLTLATSLTLFDGATVAILKENKGDFGLQRLYSNLGMIIMTPISGLLIDVFSSADGLVQDYRPAFLLYCGIKIICAGLVLFIDLDFKQPSNQVLKDMRSLLRCWEIICFLLMTFIGGVCYGYIDTFLFWLLQDMGANKQLMGMTVTVGASFGIPVLVFATPIIEKLGHVNTISIGFAVFIIRMMGYSLIQNPWLAMPFEALECFSVSLMGVAIVSYAAHLSSPSTVASLQGLVGGIQHGVGRGTGSLVGGFLIGYLGTRNTFKILAALSAVTCAFYLLMNLLFFRRRPRVADEKAKETSSAHPNIEKGRDATIDKKESEDNDDCKKQIEENGKTNEIRADVKHFLNKNAVVRNSLSRNPVVLPNKGESFVRENKAFIEE